MTNSPSHLFQEASKLASSLNWADSAFSWEKSHVAALISALAYEYIAPFEIEDAERAKLIPCESYQKKIIHKEIITVEQFQDLLKSEYPVEIIENDYFVSIVIPIKDVIFISIRGTTNLYDLRVDLDFRKTQYPPYRKSLIKFHRGFFDAINADLAGIIRALYRVKNNNVPLYITGHSLGGALGAILDILLHDRFSINYWGLYPEGYDYFRPVASYTFGMPRYGNYYAISYCRTPYHVYNQKDIVPTLPPRYLGYSDLHKEYCLNSTAQLFSNYIKGNCGLRFSYKKIEILSARVHKMEQYIKLLELASSIGVN